MKKLLLSVLIVLVLLSFAFPAAAAPARDENIAGMFPAIQFNLYPLGIDIRHVSSSPYYTEQPPSSPWTGIQAVVINHSANRYGLPATGYVTTGCITTYGSSGCTPKQLIIYMVDNQSGQQGGDGSQVAVTPTPEYTICYNLWVAFWQDSALQGQHEWMSTSGMAVFCSPLLYLGRYAAKTYAWTMHELYTVLERNADTLDKRMVYRSAAAFWANVWASIEGLG